MATVASVTRRPRADGAAGEQPDVHQRGHGQHDHAGLVQRDAAQSGELTFEVLKVPLSDIETAWRRTDLRGRRLVVVP